MNVSTGSTNQATAPPVDLITEVFKKIVVIMDIIRPAENILKHSVLTDLESSIASCSARVTRLEDFTSVYKQGLGGLSSHLASCSSFSHSVKANPVSTATVVDTTTVIQTLTATFTETLTGTLNEMTTATFTPDVTCSPFPHPTLPSADGALLPHLRPLVILIPIFCVSALSPRFFKRKTTRESPSIFFFGVNILVLRFIGYVVSRFTSADGSSTSAARLYVGALCIWMLESFAKGEASSNAEPKPPSPPERNAQDDGKESHGNQEADHTPSQRQQSPESQSKETMPRATGPEVPEPEDTKPTDAELANTHISPPEPITPLKTFSTQQDNNLMPPPRYETQRNPFDQLLNHSIQADGEDLQSNNSVQDGPSPRSLSPILASRSSSPWEEDFSLSDRDLSLSEDGFSVIDSGEAEDRPE